jgi:hypothetical protein
VKKILGILLAVLFVIGMSMPSFAAKTHGKKATEEKKYDRIVAEVVSLDVTAKTIVVKEEKGGASRTVKISKKAASELKVGDRVRIKLKAGTNESAGVRVLKAEVKDEPVDEPKAEAVGEPEKK